MISFWRFIDSIRRSTESLNSEPKTVFLTMYSSLERYYFLSKNFFSSFYLSSKYFEVSFSFLFMNWTSCFIWRYRSLSSLMSLAYSSRSRCFSCFSSMATSSIPSLLRRSSLMISFVMIMGASSGSSTYRRE
jgi:hypothetical protein